MAKIGEGHAEAWLRAGGKELGQALVALPDSNIRPIEEPGLFGTATQYVANQQMGYGRDAHLEGAADRAPQIEPPEPEIEMGE
jgi:hypothetical protein